MKKIKQLAILAILSTGMADARAQVDGTFCFLDAAGSEVPDGSTVTFYAETTEIIPGVPELGTETKAEFGLSVKNTTDETCAVAARIVTQELSSGSVQFCFPNQCQSGTLPAHYTSDCRNLTGGTVIGLNSEWLPVEGTYGEARFTLQLLLADRNSDDDFTVRAEGPKINIRCVYAAPTEIGDIFAREDAAEVVRYGSCGRKLSAPVKGLNIIRLSDGRTVKIVEKE